MVSLVVSRSHAPRRNATLSRSAATAAPSTRSVQILRSDAERGNENANAWLATILSDSTGFGDPHRVRISQQYTVRTARYARCGANWRRLSLNSLSSAFCGSANFSSPSRINSSSISCESTFASISARTSAGGNLVDRARNVRPLFCTASFVAGGFVWISLPASAIDVLPRRILRLLRARAGENDFLMQRRLAS